MSNSIAWLVHPLHPLAVSWASQVVINGGASPSNQSIVALSEFCYGLDSFGLTSSMICVNCYAPDSITAARTPVIVGGGNDPWTVGGVFAGSTLTIGGLKGTGSQYLNSGIVPSSVYGSVNDCGLTLYITDGNDGQEVDIAAYQSSSQNNILFADWEGSSYFDCYGSGTGRISNPTVTGYGTGLISGNRTDATHEYLYSVTSGGIVTVAGPGGSPGSLPTIPYYVHAQNSNGAGTNYSIKRIAFAAIHHGLSDYQVLLLFTLVKTMRDKLAGLPAGHHSLVSMWYFRVIGNGGAAPSSATLSALDTFCADLDSAGITSIVFSRDSGQVRGGEGQQEGAGAGLVGTCTHG